jgi:glycosyltransferase involved in cell wall biosynthesis
VLLVENDADRAWVDPGGALGDARVLRMPGAGVDATLFPATPEPAGPIVVGIVSRLVRSKGVDLAVAAAQRLRASGLPIVLRVAGEPDADNPGRVDAAELARWGATPGVELCGRTDDIAGFWRSAHIACLPSRGGEGLPRSLLEAAACGRPIVTTATPGCADFVIGDETGLIVPCEDDAALAVALARLASDGVLRQRLGAAGRARVLAGYTEAHAAAIASEAWRRCLTLGR